MPQRKKKPRPRGNPDHRRRVNTPAPSTPEIEQRLQEVLSPACVAQVTRPGLKLRNRVLTLPVMVAIVIGMVWRQVPSLCELVRLLAREGLLWLNVVKVSQPALSKRLLRLPASLFEAVFAPVVEALHARSAERLAARGGVVAQLRTRFTAIWLADGSTLEALVKKTVVSLKMSPNHLVLYLLAEKG